MRTPQDLLKVYLHEANRVYRDKMVDHTDFALFDKLQSDKVKKIYQVRELNPVSLYSVSLHGLPPPGVHERREKERII